jgi:hypothetical protein
MLKTCLLITVLCGIGGFPVKADTIVMNGGFETADLSGWTVSGAHSSPGDEGIYYGVDAVDAHTGRYGAYFGPVGGVLNLTQTLNTVPGTFYSLSFWLAQAPATPFPYVNSFTVSFGGTTLFSQTAVPAGAYTQYSFAQFASSASTTLAFAFRNDVGFFSLDDVAVMAADSVPEPASWLLVASALGGLSGVRLRVLRGVNRRDKTF